MMFTGGAGVIVLILWALILFYGVGAYLSTLVSFPLAARARLVISAPPFLQTTKAVAAGFVVYVLCGVFTGGLGFWLFPIVNIVGLFLLRSYAWPSVTPISRGARIAGTASLLIGQVLLSVAIAYGVWRLLFVTLPAPY